MTCFNRYHMDELEKYVEVKKCLDILANKLNIIKWKDCEWQETHVQNYVYPQQSDSWHYGNICNIGLQGVFYFCIF